MSLYLNLQRRFHLLKPDYIHHRIKELQRSFRLRVLMCHVDIDDVIEPLQQITRAALLNDVTLICGWSHEVRNVTSLMASPLHCAVCSQGGYTIASFPPKLALLDTAEV